MASPVPRRLPTSRKINWLDLGLHPLCSHRQQRVILRLFRLREGKNDTDHAGSRSTWRRARRDDDGSRKEGWRWRVGAGSESAAVGRRRGLEAGWGGAVDVRVDRGIGFNVVDGGGEWRRDWVWWRGVDAESTFETLNATWILQSEGTIWVSQLF